MSLGKPSPEFQFAKRFSYHNIQFEKRWTTSNVEWVVWGLPTHTTNNFCVAGIAIDLCPYVIQACHKQGGRGATCPPPPVFGRSVIPYLNQEDTLCPPHYYVPFRIFRPCDGPVCWIVSAEWWSFHLEDSKLISSFQNYVKLETRSFVMNFNSTAVWQMSRELGPALLKGQIYQRVKNSNFTLVWGQ